MPKVLNILSIVFPFLMIVLGLIRYYSDGKRNFGGTITFLAFLLLLIGLFRYFFIGSGGGSNHSGPKPESIHVSKHSEAFNQSIGNVLMAYYQMTEDFVNWDSTVINSSANNLKNLLDSVKLDELKNDSSGIYESALDPLANSKTEIAAIIADPSFSERRGSLNILSDNLRLFLTTVKYDRAVLYWQECPMAFGEDKPGNWISQSKETRNPYFGTKDPQHGDKMLNCGAPKYIIKFDPPPGDTTKKQ
jgi:hypothetical protein